ncbi:MAG TPA: YdeI/OmpD-associated family protein [Candidatus Dormibacteraeota bacterium]
MKLTTVINAAGKTAAGIVVPDEFVDALGGGGRPKVSVTVAGHTYRSSIARMGGVYMLTVSNETRAATGLKPGQTAEFDIELDTAPREVAVPAELQAALDRNPAAKAAFEELSYSNKRRLAEPIAAIKNPETRARRAEKTAAGLHSTAGPTGLR